MPPRSRHGARADWLSGRDKRLDDIAKDLAITIATMALLFHGSLRRTTRLRIGSENFGKGRAAQRPTAARLPPERGHRYCNVVTGQTNSLSNLRFSLVGPGRVGSSLASWAVSHGASLLAVVGSTPTSGRELATALGGRVADFEQLAGTEQDLILLAVSDDQLTDTAIALAKAGSTTTTLHTSGKFDSTVLEPLRQNGASVGSLHPLKAFPQIISDSRQGANTVFGIDGDQDAQTLAVRLVHSWAAIPVEISAEVRPLYHLAATLAAGGVVTLLASACELASRLGLPKQVRIGYFELARGAIERAATSPEISAAITGPVARGDLEGFRAQIEALRTLDPELAAFVESLAKRTIHHCHPEPDPELPRS